jgi:FKBP-type peptidyl-prolyl cis-trans isomerase
MHTANKTNKSAKSFLDVQNLSKALLCICLSFSIVSCSEAGIKMKNKDATTQAFKNNTKTKGVKMTEAGFEATPSGLQIKDEVVGNGETAKAGKKVAVHYTGTLYPEGSKFDSSKDRGQPFQFNLGAGQVIKGWDEGVAGMKVGGKRVLVIPSNLAYGRNGAPPVIPPDATLKFEVELLDVK